MAFKIPRALLALIVCLLALPTPALAADPPAKPVAAPNKAEKATSKADLTRKFCCKNANNIGCYVFGNASCNNCTAFCSGDMHIQIVPPETK